MSTRTRRHALWRHLALVTAVLTGAAAVALAQPANAAGPRPRFQLPFPCGEAWRLSTYAAHNPVEKLDIFPADGSTANGRTVVASADGIAYGVYAPNSSGGNQVAIDHGGGWVTMHLHLQNGSLLVPSTGRRVRAGEPIARAGNTGTNTSGPHLHYEQIRDASVTSTGHVNYGTIVRAEFDGVPVNVTPTHSEVHTSRNCGGDSSHPNGIAWYEGNTIYTFAGLGLNTAGSVGGVNDPDVWLGAVDYNRDGRDDLAVYYPDGSFHVWQSNGSTFGSIGRVRGPGVGRPHTAVTGDFTGSGRRDSIAWYEGNTIYTFAGSGLNTAGAVSGVNDPNVWLGAVDYNRDRREDLAVYYPSDGSFHLWQSTGSSFASIGRVRGPGVGRPHTAVTGDFTGSGRRDSIAWYEGNTIYTFAGLGLNTAGSVSGVNDPNVWLGALDYNNDGKDDLAIYYPSDGSFHLWQSTGSTFVSIGKVRGPGVGNPHTAITGHFN